MTRRLFRAMRLVALLAVTGALGGCAAYPTGGVAYRSLGYSPGYYGYAPPAYRSPGFYRPAPSAYHRPYARPYRDRGYGYGPPYGYYGRPRAYYGRPYW